MSQATAKVPKVSPSCVLNVTTWLLLWVWFMCLRLSFKSSEWELFGVWPTPLLQNVSGKRLNPGAKAGSATKDYHSLGENKCVSGGEWLTDDKEALASILLLDLPAAKKYSGYAEQTFATPKSCRFSDAEAAVRQPSDRQEAVTTQPEIQAPQHRSSFPATIDSADIQQHRRSASSATLPLYCLPPPPPPPQLPSYAQSLAKSQFCYSERPPDPPAYASSAVVSQPLGVSWTPVSTGKNPPNQVLRRIQSFTSSMSCGGASSLPRTMQLYSQKLSRPTSTIHGTTGCSRSALDVGQTICAGVKNVWYFHATCILYFFFLFSTWVTKRSDSSKLKSNSVGTFKELHPWPEPTQSNQQAFLSALQKLADKQAARRYASSSHINLLTHHVSPGGPFVSFSVLKLVELGETATWRPRDTPGGFLFMWNIELLVMSLHPLDLIFLVKQHNFS